MNPETIKKGPKQRAWEKLTIQDQYSKVLNKLQAVGAKDQFHSLMSCDTMQKSWLCDGTLWLDPPCDGTMPFDEGQEIPLDLIDGAQVVRHRVAKDIYCNLPYCPACGQYDSLTHRRRTERVLAKSRGVRLAKWTITFPVEDAPLFQARKDVGDAMKMLGGLAMAFYRAPAARTVVHPLGDETQGLHFEVYWPDHGTFLQPDELEDFKLTVMHSLQLSQVPVCEYDYVGVSLPPAEQGAKNHHLVKYAHHPSLPAWRLVEMHDDDAAEIVTRFKGFETTRGYGLWSKRKINSAKTAELATIYPMPEVWESETQDEDAIKDGAPCPCCVAKLVGQEVGKKYRAEGLTIADGVTIYEHQIYVGSNHVAAALAVARTSGTQIYWDVGHGILIDASADFPPLPDVPRETTDERVIKDWYKSAPALTEWERWRRRKASGALPDELAPSA
jgi:hypothetical protein